MISLVTCSFVRCWLWEFEKKKIHPEMQITPGRCLFPVRRTEAVSVMQAQGDGSSAAASVNAAFAREKIPGPMPPFSMVP